MGSGLPLSLALKARLLGTPIEPILMQLRWVMGLGQRIRHPELYDIYLEDRRLRPVLQKILNDTSTVIDVGAHIGSFLSVANKLSPNGQHFAFEPSTEKSEWLKRKYPGVQVFAMAVGESAGRGIFEENVAHPGFSRLLTDQSSSPQSREYEVPICTIDEKLGHLDKIDLIKMDIEGGELSALKGGLGTIRQFKPPVLFECGPVLGNEDKLKYRQEMYNFFSNELKYHIYTYVDFLYCNKPLQFEQFWRCGEYPFRAFNFLALPDDKLPSSYESHDVVWR